MKRGFSEFSECPTGAYSKNNGELESDSKADNSPDIGISEVGTIGGDEKIIMPANNDDSTAKQVSYF